MESEYKIQQFTDTSSSGSGLNAKHLNYMETMLADLYNDQVPPRFTKSKYVSYCYSNDANKKEVLKLKIQLDTSYKKFSLSIYSNIDDNVFDPGNTTDLVPSAYQGIGYGSFTTTISRDSFNLLFGIGKNYQGDSLNYMYLFRVFAYVTDTGVYYPCLQPLISNILCKDVSYAYNPDINTVQCNSVYVYNSLNEHWDEL